MPTFSSAFPSDLITLQQASELLGVHPSTLRTWADRGKLHVVRTAGGHRRFSRQEVRDFAARHGSARDASQDAQLLVHSALGRARMALGDGVLSGEGWYRLYDESTREQHREMGRRLLDLMLHYLNERERQPELERALDEARVLGRAYGAIAARQGLSLGDAMRAFLFFRDSLLESLVQMREVIGEGADSLATYRLINHFANEVMLAMVAAFEES